MSSNNVVWVMRYKDEWHVFYSGCMDNTPTEPDYKDEYHNTFLNKNNALLYAHKVVDEINEESIQDGYAGVEYGVCEVSKVFSDCRGGKYYKEIREVVTRCKPVLDALAEKRLYVKDLQPLLKRVESLEHFQSLLMGKDIGMSNVWSRFSEMEKKFESIINDYETVECPNTNQIAELDNKYDNRTHRNLNRVRKNEEVLQKYMKLMKNYNPQSWEGVNKLLKELDSPKTEKKEDMSIDINIYKNGILEDRMVIKGEMFRKASGSERDCNDCYLYGVCDHQGAYKRKDGKWCYEDSGGEKAITAEEGVKNPSMVVKRDNISADSKLPEHLKVWKRGYPECEPKTKPKCKDCQDFDIEHTHNVCLSCYDFELFVPKDPRDEKSKEKDYTLYIPSISQETINKIMNQYRDIDEEIKELIEEFLNKLNVLWSNEPEIVFDQIQILIEEYQGRVK